MFILLTYDVDFTTENGQKRLRKIAKVCENYGIRVQNSVFELIVDNTQLTIIQNFIKSIMNEEKDSVRFYRIGKNYNEKIIVFGKQPVIKQDDTIIL